MAYEFIKNLATSLAPALLGLGTSLIMNNQAKKNAQGQANATQQALDTQYQIALKNQENIRAMQQAGKQAEVFTCLAPAWSSDWITDTAKEKLRVYGIAPPH